ncbi:MAG: hypothetical protein ACXVAY_14570 [Mucilaginibacter sp.]
MILQEFISESPKPEKVERGNGENDRPHKGNTYNNDENQNVEQVTNPDLVELPAQQKSDEDDDTDENDVI